MKYGEAFKSLGYELNAPRTDWTAEKSNGVCITLWETEIAFNEGRPWIDTKQHCKPIEVWGDSRGNKLRKRHLSRAINELDRRIDVIVVYGKPGQGVKDAVPWKPEEHLGFEWKLIWFEPESGHFSARVEASEALDDLL